MYNMVKKGNIKTILTEVITMEWIQLGLTIGVLFMVMMGNVIFVHQEILDTLILEEYESVKSK